MSFRKRSLGYIFIALGLAIGLFGCGSRGPEPAPVEPAPVEPVDKLALEPKAPPLQSQETPGGNASKEGDKSQRRSVTFMGARGSGRRVCIIADHSMSLSPWSFGQIKKEISKTLRTLDEQTPFYLTFFSKVPLPMPADDWRSGQKEIEKVEQWMATVDRKLGTLATPAFVKARALKPPPDLVFLMTDGKLLGKDPVGSIAAANRAEPKTVIHTVLFTLRGTEVGPEDPARKILEKIAAEAGGAYHQYIADAADMPPKKKKKS